MGEAPGDVVVITNHFMNSRRRANIHWLVREFARRGWRVRVLVTGMSRLARLRGDRRAAYLLPEMRRGFQAVAPDIHQSCLFTTFHPFNARHALANSALAPFARIYPKLALHAAAREAARSADIVMFESGLPLLFVDEVARLNRTARLIYRVSDDVRHLRCHPAVVRAEEAHASKFDCISVVSETLVPRFEGCAQVLTHPQALALDVLSRPFESPYPERAPGVLRLLSVGSSFFDYPALRSVIEGMPDHQLYVVGQLKGTVASARNVRCLGELAFEDTLAYMAHCDVALALYDDRIVNESLAQSSSKIAQYLYFAKPVVTTGRVARASSAPGLIGYDDATPEALADAVTRATALIGTLPSREPAVTWEGMVDEMLDSVDRRSEENATPLV
ncbi:MAG: hypothetical protein JXB36_03335 [Gammaproteobacteria bacterium]|nr:hypothetical protein [Gammaproteobacteria bacterium]